MKTARWAARMLPSGFSSRWLPPGWTSELSPKPVILELLILGDSERPLPGVPDVKRLISLGR